MGRLNIILVVVVLAIAVLVSTWGSDSIQRLQSSFLSLVSPFVKTGSAVQQQIGAVGQGLKSLDQLEAENAQLLTANKQLRAENQVLKDIDKENNKLRAALDYRARSIFTLLPARVVSHDASTWWNTIKINRGFRDGITTDQCVLTDSGLVGKTTTVAENMSIVLLVTDEGCKVAAAVEGSNEKGILSGLRVSEGAGEMQLNFLTKMANLQPEQKVYTAGVSGGVFPSGILIGTVKSFHTRALDGQALVKPAVDLSTVEDVFVVTGAR